MTYNFDPEAWRDRQLAVVQAKREKGELSGEDLEREVDEIERRYEEMLDRLDRSFEISTGRRMGQ
jgi:hypothetical protein